MVTAREVAGGCAGCATAHPIFWKEFNNSYVIAVIMSFLLNHVHLIYFCRLPLWLRWTTADGQSHKGDIAASNIVPLWRFPKVVHYLSVCSPVFFVTQYNWGLPKLHMGINIASHSYNKSSVVIQYVSHRLRREKIFCNEYSPAAILYFRPEEWPSQDYALQ